MATVRLEGVSKEYDGVPAVREVSLDVKDGELLTLLGPSGCGKTTTLRLIAGFIEPTRGRIFVGDEDVTGLPPRRRQIGMVFQDYALFPHLTVEENIAYGMARRGASRAEMRRRVAELLDLIRLAEIARRFPSEISGGQQQRVALARAIAHPPRVLLMDEPLGALDLKLREAMQAELHRIHRELGMTTVYVTHDQEEAMILSDRIAVMDRAELVQLGTAEELYNAPRSRFVAHFVGKVNFVDAEVTGDGVASAAGVRLRPPAGTAVGARRITLGIRPERLELHPAGTPAAGRNTLPGTVAGRRFVGNLVHLFVDAGPGGSFIVEQRPGGSPVQEGERVVITWMPDDAFVLHDE